MRKQEETTIGEHKYVCTMMSVRTAHHTFTELLRVLGRPVISQLAGAIDVDANAAIASAIAMALRDIDEAVADRIVGSLFEGVLAEGVGEVKPWSTEFDAMYRGDLLNMYKVCAWSIKVNYSDFLEGAQQLGLSNGVELGKKAVSEVLRTSTKESGAS